MLLRREPNLTFSAFTESDAPRIVGWQSATTPDGTTTYGGWVGFRSWVVTPEELVRSYEMPVRVIHALVDTFDDREYRAAQKARKAEVNVLRRATGLGSTQRLPRAVAPPSVRRADFEANALADRPSSDGRNYWFFRGVTYSTLEVLTDREVKALLTEAENKTKARVARAVALMEQVEVLSDARPRPPIPDDVKVFVWQRDSGACVRCGSTKDLEFDHIIPFSMGGSSSARNLQLLCEACNRAKSGSLV